MVKSQQSLFRMGKVMLPTHKSNTKHHLAHRTASQWLTPFAYRGLFRAPDQPQGFDRKNTVIGKYSGKEATAYNEHIAKIAALPSFERNYYFRGGCSLESV
jgi:hypothetical protein